MMLVIQGLQFLIQFFFPLGGMVTEEAPNDYPIGISQLSRKTFLASEDTAALFRSGQTIQDYRFTQLIEPRRR